MSWGDNLASSCAEKGREPWPPNLMKLREQLSFFFEPQFSQILQLQFASTNPMVWGYDFSVLRRGVVGKTECLADPRHFWCHGTTTLC